MTHGADNHDLDALADRLHAGATEASLIAFDACLAAGDGATGSLAEISTALSRLAADADRLAGLARTDCGTAQVADADRLPEPVA